MNPIPELRWQGERLLKSKKYQGGGKLKIKVRATNDAGDTGVEKVSRKLKP